MIPGETIASGAPSWCDECQTDMKLEVLMSYAGYYIGTMCGCGPYSRESGYYRTHEEAQKDLDDDTWVRRG